MTVGHGGVTGGVTGGGDASALYKELHKPLVHRVRDFLGDVMSAVETLRVLYAAGELLPDVQELLRALRRMTARAPHDHGRHVDLAVAVGGVHREIAGRRRAVVPTRA